MVRPGLDRLSFSDFREDFSDFMNFQQFYFGTND